MPKKMTRAEFLAAKLQKLAKDKGVNRENVVNDTKIGKAALYRYFAGTTKQPDAFMLVKLARYFGVSLDYLVGTNDDDLDSAPTELATVAA